jgi:hypothetical protein
MLKIPAMARADIRYPLGLPRLAHSLTSLLAAAAVAALACNSEPVGRAVDPRAGSLSAEELRDPELCRDCHADHYRQWAGSMHAYATRDPVFLAMNRRGQEETGGALGDFCVRCHAPLAVELGLTTDGLNLEELPDAVRAVTCYACHNVDRVLAPHNNGLRIAHDSLMRGGISSPLPAGVHGSAYSELFDANALKSSEMCGACHDLVTPSGVALEQTFNEWYGSVFGPLRSANRSAVLTCSMCHMPPEPGLTTQSGRPVHGHQMAAVDVALTPFPADAPGLADEQRELVQRLLDSSIGVEICVQVLPGDQSAVFVTLENASAGHNWPSGAAQDRRAWVELHAYAGERLLYSSGVVAEGEDVTRSPDPDLWLFRDTLLNEARDPVHMFWEAATVERGTIPAPLTISPSSPDFSANHVTRRYPLDSQTRIAGLPDRVQVRVRMLPIGLDVLDDLTASGHLEPSFRERMPTFDLIPNRHLAAHPTLSRLAQATFEWSEATRAEAAFSRRMLLDEFFAKDCIGMSPQR